MINFNYSLLVYMANFIARNYGIFHCEEAGKHQVNKYRDKINIGKRRLALDDM